MAHQIIDYCSNSISGHQQRNCKCCCLSYTERQRREVVLPADMAWLKTPHIGPEGTMAFLLKAHNLFIFTAHCPLKGRSPPFESSVINNRTRMATSLKMFLFLQREGLIAWDGCTLPSLKHPLWVWSWPFVMWDKLPLPRQPAWPICQPIRERDTACILQTL